MGSLFAKHVPDNLIEILDNWRKNQVPALNRSQTVTLIVKEWAEIHKNEFIKEGIITNEQMNLFNGK